MTAPDWFPPGAEPLPEWHGRYWTAPRAEGGVWLLDVDLVGRGCPVVSRELAGQAAFLREVLAPDAIVSVPLP